MAKNTKDKLYELEQNMPGAFATSAETNAAKNQLAQYENSEPQYQSNYQGIINNLATQIANRNKFEYNPDTDEMYQRALSSAMRSGKQAMNDTIGAAQALNGGYATSWAQSAGQQAYNDYISAANDKIPDYYALALDVYNTEGNEMRNNLAMYQGIESDAYGTYVDEYNKWNADRNYYADKYNSLYNSDLNAYNDNYNKWAAERDYYANKDKYEDDLIYQQSRDTISDERYNNEFNYQKEKDYLSMMASTAESSSGSSASTKEYDPRGKSIIYGAGVGYNENDDGSWTWTDQYGAKRKTQKNANPYTGTVNKDAAKGVFSNGYQPNNINGVKLSSTKFKVDVEQTHYGNTSVNSQTVWTDGNYYYIWDGLKNKYDKYSASELEDILMSQQEARNTR